MKFLIPPSEGKSTQNTTNVLFKDSDFIYKIQVNQILKTLKTVEENDFKKTYGIVGGKAKLIHKLNLNIKKGLCSPAINRYSGTVFSNIGFETFNSTQKEFFNEHFLILSGLFGMVHPMTLIPNYKLKMNILQLHKLWNPILSKELSHEISIIDLLPQIHKKAYTPNRNCKNIDFVLHKNGKKIHAGHFGKVVKGKFIRFICQYQLTQFEDLIKFEYDGFKWNGEVFLKNN